MKMVKSLLLVSAAGLVAVSGAQAADLPVKAKPVEYVKVCSLYGAGFYYIPGTDICLKIGGYVRYQVNANTSSITAGPFAGGNAFNTRLTGQDFAQRVRATLTVDSRQQTAYGTLRTYMLIGYTQDTNANAGLTAAAGANTPLYATRAFIQLAGFTFGKATSFFDFISSAAVAYNAGYTFSPDTGDSGQIVGSYTAQLGNGVSASFGIEQNRRNNTVFTNTAFPTTGFTNTAFAANNLGNSVAQTSVFPDFVGNIRIDQAWGAAQISAAAHDASAGYYGISPGGAAGVSEANGHPNNTWGYAVSAGLRLNAPMIGPGDYFQMAYVYSQGAMRYANNTPGGGGILQRWDGNQFAFGHADDAYFSGNAPGNVAFGGTTANGLNLTTAWSVFASYEHFWTPALRTSLYGSYLGVSQNATVKAQHCAAATAVVNAVGAGGVGFGTQAGCSPDWSSWNVGTRSQWNITKDLYVGVDVIYSKLNSATLSANPVSSAGLASAAFAGAGKAAGIYQNSDLDAVSTTWRVHRDIVP